MNPTNFAMRMFNNSSVNAFISTSSFNLNLQVKIMKATAFLFLIITAFQFQNSKANSISQPFDKTDFYQVLKSGSIKEINKEITLIESSSLNDKDAFKGALLMKKAGLVNIPKQKLDYFKTGRIKLETVLRNDSSNVEYRFLRLIIQEHAPKVVKYNSEISNDAAFIKKNYKELTADVQKILIDYSQTSKSLKPQDFQP